jgi:site-specific DNA-methyltransferase (adenine-specific)
MTTKNWQLLNRVINGDCLEVMKQIEDHSVDMILCDLPYGTTACKWDTVINFDQLWSAYKRVIKANGAIVLTASQPFTTLLIGSNLNAFKHSWVWDKKAAANIMNARNSPLKVHEDVCVFSYQKATYNPQMVKGKSRVKGGHKERDNIYGHQEAKVGVVSDEYYPKSIIEFSNASRNDKQHPTQKPVALFEYLIKTYSNPGETILDNCLGSGTTAVAAINTDRNFIGIELDPGYCEIAGNRIESAKQSKLN